jgi:hypothetical protein
VPVSLADRVHRHGVGEDEAAEAHLLAQQTGEDSADITAGTPASMEAWNGASSTSRNRSIGWSITGNP